MNIDPFGLMEEIICSECKQVFGMSGGDTPFTQICIKCYKSLTLKGKDE